MQTDTSAERLYRQPAELLRALLRFDTTNPPGNESACIEYIAAQLRAVDVVPQILARDDGRPNLVAKIAGRGIAPPLLLYGHVDVVTTHDQDWTHPPFAAAVADGFIWGRGALDMKGGVAMLLAAFMRAQVEGASVPGDIVLALVSDEENLGHYGAGFLVEEHADLFAGIRYALGEFGGFSTALGNRLFYPIMVAEKQSCLVRATICGPGGHASLPLRDSAMARLGRLLRRLNRQRLPVHVTPVARLMIETLAAELPWAQRAVLRQLLNPPLTDRALGLLGAQGVLFDPLLHNTVSPTIVQGGEKLNVHPSKITLELDGRILPGYSGDDLLRELRVLAGPHVELELGGVDPNPAPAQPDMGLFPLLSNILREADPAGIPLPLLLSAVTDGRYFSRLGIQTYGFLPMKLPPGWDFSQVIHAADERIPVEAVAFGAEAIYQALLRFR